MDSVAWLSETRSSPAASVKTIIEFRQQQNSSFKEAENPSGETKDKNYNLSGQLPSAAGTDLFSSEDFLLERR